MLPTEDKTNIAIMRSGNRLVFIKEPLDLNNGFQHIYITVSDEIKDGDWCIAIDTNILFQVGLKDLIGLKDFPFNYRKIISTNNRSVNRKKVYRVSKKGETLHQDVRGTYEWVNIIPNVSQDFIKAFVESNGKEDWYIEREPICCKAYTSCNSNCRIEGWNIKLDSNNCVILTAVEEKMYSRDELISLSEGRSVIVDWIRENL